MAAWLEFKKNHPFDEKIKETGISGKSHSIHLQYGRAFSYGRKENMGGGCGSGISWLKALLVSYLISVLLLLLLSFLLWNFLEGSWVQAGIVVIYLASSFSGGRMAGNMAGNGGFSGASALESCILPF